MAIEVVTLGGEQLALALDALAQLRIRVFAEWPYLYNGDLNYERAYLREFGGEEGSVLVAAFDGGTIVGAATASPMSGQKPEFRQPFVEMGIGTGRLFYFGESVLLPEYRGRGVGHLFFDKREAAARAAGASHAAFCAVIRSTGDPRCPTGYRALDDFWRSRGYEKVDRLVTSFDWKELGCDAEVSHPMQFWMGEL